MTRAATLQHASATPFHCGLCGLEFSEGERACSSCAICPGCDLVKCPRCGTQFPRGSRLVAWFGRLLHGSVV